MPFFNRNNRNNRKPKPIRRVRQDPPEPIPAKIVGLPEFNFKPERFPSMTAAKKRLAAIIKMLVPKKSADEPKKFWIKPQ